MPARPATALVATSLAATVVVIVIACASSSTPKSTAGIDQLPLAPGRDPGHFVYREPNLDPSQYKALLIDDTVVFSGPGTDFGKTSPQDQQRLAMLLTKSLNDELRKRNYHLATGPWPGCRTTAHLLDRHHRVQAGGGYVGAAKSRWPRPVGNKKRRGQAGRLHRLDHDFRRDYRLGIWRGARGLRRGGESARP